MTRYGLLSDVHGNNPALRAALSFLERQGVEAYLCAGDVVGYGPQPNECVKLLASIPVQCVAGNHDLIATGQLGDEGIGRLARRTLAFTRAELEPAARAWLERLPERLAVHGAQITHASLTGPRRYVATDALAALELALLRRADASARVLVIGHTHRATVFGERSGRVRAVASEPVPVGAAERWLINPGAVGQSREREVRACVAVLDLAREERPSTRCATTSTRRGRSFAGEASPLTRYTCRRAHVRGGSYRGSPACRVDQRHTSRTAYG